MSQNTFRVIDRLEDRDAATFCGFGVFGGGFLNPFGGHPAPAHESHNEPVVVHTAEANGWGWGTDFHGNGNHYGCGGSTTPAPTPTPTTGCFAGTLLTSGAEGEGNSAVAGGQLGLADSSGDVLYIVDVGGDGSFAFTDVAPGTYTVIYTGSALAANSQSLTITAGENVTTGQLFTA